MFCSGFAAGLRQSAADCQPKEHLRVTLGMESPSTEWSADDGKFTGPVTPTDASVDRRRVWRLPGSLLVENGAKNAVTDEEVSESRIVRRTSEGAVDPMVDG